MATKFDLVGLAEIAKMAKLDRGTIRGYRARGKLPQPVTELACGPIWERKQIVAWIKERAA